MSDHSKGQPKDTSPVGQPTNKDVIETHVSQKKRSPERNQHHTEPADDLSSLSQSFHSFTEEIAESPESA
jgi:hypothetical protein